MMMIPSAILHVITVLALATGLTLAPVQPAYEPDPAEVALISRTIWGEARGCPREEREAVAWCILNRVDDPRFPDTVEAVVTAPYQFLGYSEDFPAEDFAEEARDVLIRWHGGEHGIDPSLVFFHGDGEHNYFRSVW